MNSQQIRKTFESFFAERGHAVVPSASLIPIDPTLLLTVAGMVPFKPYLLGEETPSYRRAVSVQKCGRTEDIDIVGTTARHLTFFEMLGNFSFGDYFKEKAIPWAYELVTEGFGLDPERLWFTVHHSDDEAADIWIDQVGIDPKRLQRRGDSDNFWQMGVPGPCGPSSEIFFDKGPAHGPDGGPEVDEERFMEIWNLVFMQNVQDEPYHVVGDLPAKNIDTGAGLERLAIVLQGVDSIFKTDELRKVISAAERATGAGFGEHERSDVSLRILGDHGRAVTFLIADKVVPSNQGRGYVLRRLLRRAVRHAVLLGSKDNIMPILVEATVAAMGEAYPDLVARQDAILEMAEREEGRFRRTLESGHQLLDEALEPLEDGGTLAGEVAFKLHDTHGFPRELTEEILAERGFRLDLEEFERMMTVQKEQARANFKTIGTEVSDEYRALVRGLEGTDFTGYDAEAGTGRLLSIFREGDPVDKAEEGQQVEIFLDRTPFYAESGGQIGDTGQIKTETGIVEVADTQLALPGVHGHRGTVVAGHVEVGQDAETSIARTRRERIRKNHTGTHLLHWALREVLGDHVHQEGSLVADSRLRFDFSHYKAVEPDELVGIEQAVNQRVVENAEVTTIETSKDEAEQMGALAFFGDKYGERVRVVKTGNYSTEFCGGTHVPSTGQIGPLVLVSEGSVAANTRRVEALTGVAGYEHLIGIRNQLRDTASLLRVQEAGVVDAARGLTLRLKDQEDRIAEFESRQRTEIVDRLLAGAETHDGHALVVVHQPEASPDELRALAFQLRDRIDSGIGVLGSSVGGKAALLAFATEDLVTAGVSAGEITGIAARVVGGGGSRDPQLAQAGGPNGDEVEAALEVAAEAARAGLQGV